MSLKTISSTSASQTAVHSKRKRQIDSLKVFNTDVTEIVPGLEYQVGFQIGYPRQNFQLRVRLPPEFPMQQPLIWVSPFVSHPWVVDNSGRVMSPGLVNYSEHSELGQIVNSIIYELKKSEGVNGSTSASGLTKSNFVAASQYDRYFPIPPFIPEIEQLSLSELENLNDNDDLLNQFVEELPQASSVLKEIDSLIDDIKELSTNMKDKKDCLNNQRQKLLESYGTFNVLRQQWDSLSSQHQTLSKRYLPTNIEIGLQQAAAKAEEESEEIAEIFLSGNMDVDKFINMYTASRTASHSRKMKEEILHKQLQELQRLGY